MAAGRCGEIRAAGAGWFGYLYRPYARFWVETERRQEFETASDLHRCNWGWRRHTESVLAHRNALPPEQYHCARYEALAARGDEEAERSWTSRGIDDPLSRRRFHEAVARSRADSAGRWREELTPSHLARIDAEADSLLEALGYGA